MQDKIIGRTRTCVNVVYAQSLRAPCDLDFQASDIVLPYKTSFVQNNFEI